MCETRHDKHVKETLFSLDREDSNRRSHGLWMSVTRRCNGRVTLGSDHTILGLSTLGDPMTVACRTVTRMAVDRGWLTVSFFSLCDNEIGYC